MFARVVSAAALVVATGVVSAQTPRRITIEEGQPAPVKLTTVPPIYPEEAKREKISGRVYLDIVIATNGSVLEARVLRSVHPSLSDAAIQAVGKWKYKPTTVDDEPVEVALTVSVQFVLPEE